MFALLVLGLALVELPAGVALDNGVARTPVLGFNSWNIFACAVNETVMMRTMDAFVNLGLRDLGFKTVSVDDWPGSFLHEYQDAATYASWGVDLLKYDNCGDQNVIGPPERGYAVMRDALNASGRPIVFAACEWAVNFPGSWMPAVANSWRSTYDIQNLWEYVVPHVDWTNAYADAAHPGAFNDMDILEVGNGVLTPAEGVAHFSLWAALKSPLLIGCDLSTPDCISNATEVFSNAEILAISQDALGIQAKRVASSGPQGIPFGKSGKCGTEELAQNTIIAPCNVTDPLQRWAWSANGSIAMTGTGECLQLDSGQGGHCGQFWTIWTNNVASGLCGDPASSCGGKQELWTYAADNRTVTNTVNGQCLTVHSALRNVGTLPCSMELEGMQTWDWEPTTGLFVSSVSPPGVTTRSCLARTPDVRGGALEVFAGPLAGGDMVVLLWNRNAGASANITAQWADLGLAPSTRMNVRDVWAHADLGVATGSVTGMAEVHGVVVLRLSPAR